MAVTQKRRNVVKNPGRLSPAQIKAGFGGKRRQSALKAKRHKPASKPKAKAKARKNKARSAPKASSHRPRTAPRKQRRAKQNTGKIVSFLLPKESAVATTKANRSRKNKSRTRKPATMKHNKRRAKRNPSVGDLGGLVSSAVFVIAGAVGSKYATQMALGASNNGVMGYFGNLVAAFILSWGVKSFMKNEKAAAAVLSGGIVQVVLRLINDYTPFGQYTANIGMGDTGCAGMGMGAYMPQNFLTPQRLLDGMHSAALQTFPGNGMNGCGGSLYSNTGGLYSSAA